MHHITHVAYGSSERRLWTVVGVVMTDGSRFFPETNPGVSFSEAELAEQVRLDRMRRLKSPVVADSAKAIWREPDGRHWFASRADPTRDDSKSLVEFA
jgi:hypothetical protein